jgi:tetratricopeptide (TPR) repeat protein
MRGQDWIPLLLVAAVGAVFHSVGEHEFVRYDDFDFIVQNPILRDGLSPTGLVHAFQTNLSNWIPLTFLSFQLDYSLYGLDPAGYHLTNVALHALSAIALYFALLSMTGAVGRSAFVAAVFAIHPLHVESVAWATERKDTLSGLFWMLTLWVYARYVRQHTTQRYLAVLSLFTLGLLAKATLVTLPFALLLLDYWPLNRLGKSDASAWPEASALRRAVFEKIPMFALASAVCAITYFAQQSGGSMYGHEVFPLGLRVANAINSYAIYAFQTLWPSDLAVFYPYPPKSIEGWRVAVASACVIAATAAGLKTACARPALLVGWLWYLGTLIPVIGIVQVGLQARADRYMYIPIIGLAILIAWGAAGLAERWQVPRRALGAAAVAALVALGVVASNLVDSWRDSEALYRRALSVTERNHLAHKGLAGELLREQRFDEAEDHFAEAARIAPNWVIPRLGVADVALARGQLAEALHVYEAELARSPADYRISERYGIALGLAGRFSEARVHLSRALNFHSAPELHRAMADIEAALGDTRAAVHHGRETLRLAPDDTGARNNLAWTLATTGDAAVRNPQEAIALIESTALESDSPWMLDTLAAAYAAAGRFDTAITTGQRAAQLAHEIAETNVEQEIRARIALYAQRTPFIH